MRSVWVKVALATSLFCGFIVFFPLEGLARGSGGRGGGHGSSYSYSGSHTYSPGRSHTSSPSTTGSHRPASSTPHIYSAPPTSPSGPHRGSAATVAPSASPSASSRPSSNFSSSRTTTPRTPSAHSRSRIKCESCERDSHGRIKRDSTAVWAFKQNHPKPPGCEDCQVDHIIPLNKGGIDHPSNMQWLSRKEHQDKTKRDLGR